MDNIERLDFVLQDLEESSNGIKKIRTVYEELMKVANNLDLLSVKIESSELILNELSQELKTEQGRLSNVCKKLGEELSEKLERYDGQLVSRLERFLSDTKVEIRNSGERLERSMLMAVEQRTAELGKQVAADVQKVGNRGLVWTGITLGILVISSLIIILLILR